MSHALMSMAIASSEGKETGRRMAGVTSLQVSSRARCPLRVNSWNSELRFDSWYESVSVEFQKSLVVTAVSVSCVQKMSHTITSVAIESSDANSSGC